MGSLYLGGPTIQEVNGKMMMGLSIYGVAVISGSLYSRFYGTCIIIRTYVYIDNGMCLLNAAAVLNLLSKETFFVRSLGIGIPLYKGVISILIVNSNP